LIDRCGELAPELDRPQSRQSNAEVDRESPPHAFLSHLQVHGLDEAIPDPAIVRAAYCCIPLKQRVHGRVSSRRHHESSPDVALLEHEVTVNGFPRICVFDCGTDEWNSRREQVLTGANRCHWLLS